MTHLQKKPQSTPFVRKRHQGGGTAVGFLVGVMFGLAVAAAVALVVSRSPLPFVNKSEQVNATVIKPKNGVLPDPNAGLRPTEAAPPSSDDASKASAATTSATVKRASDYMLQAGAYRSEADAQAMRARLVLIGFEAQVRAAKIDNSTVYRVRIGPFTALDEMNSARAELANSGIEASVVRQ